MNKIKFLCLFFSVIMCFQLTACGKNAATVEENNYCCQVSTHEVADSYVILRGVAEKLNAGDFKIIRPDDSLSLYSGGVFQSAFIYNGQMNEIHDYLQQHYSFVTGEWTVRSAWDVEVDNVIYEDITNVFSGLDGILYCIIHTKDDEPRLATLSQDGEVTEILGDATDLWQRLLESQNNHVFCDKAGNIYFTDSVLNPTGGVTTKVVAYDKALQIQWERDYGGRISGLLQADASAEIVWYGTNAAGQITMWHEDGKEFPINDQQVMPGGDAMAAYAEDGSCYFLDGQALWIRGENGFAKVYDLVADGYRIDELYGMLSDEDGGICALAKMYGDLVLLEFDFDENAVQEEKQEITIAFGMQNVSLNSVIARYNRQSKKYHISVILPEDREDIWSFRQRMQLEISAGRGPDMFGDDTISDPVTLAEKGYLECLDAYDISAEGCIAAVFEDEQFFGRQYGIPYDFTLDYAAYRKSDVNGEEPFTIEKLMECVRGKGSSILQRRCYCKDIIIRYALSDLSNNTYIDWENGKAHLTEQPFMELLEFARTYGYENSDENQIRYQDIFAAGSYLSGESGLDDVQMLQKDYDILDGEPIFLGYPRKEGYGIYVIARSIYVSGQSEHKEGAVDFLNYLISDRAQEKYISYAWTRDFPADGSLFRNYFPLLPVSQAAMERYLEDVWRQNESNKQYGISLFTEEQFENFRFLIENARPANPYVKEISAMVEEDLAPYFEGEKTAEQVTEILNNRVQLYLDERNISY